MNTLLAIVVIFALLALVGIVLSFMRLRFLLAAPTALLVLVLAVIGAILTVPMMVTLDDFKPQIVQSVKDSTGRTLTLGGPITFKLWPVLGLGVSDVIFSNHEGAKEPVMMSVKSATIGVELMALRQKQINITEFQLVEPDIVLTTDSKGKGNWVFVNTKAQNAPSEAKDGEAATEVSPPGSTPAGGGLSVSNFIIEKGHFIFRPHNGREIELNDVNAKLDMSDMDATGSMQADMGWNGRKVALDVTFDTPNTLMKDRSGTVKVDLDAGPDSLSWKGDIEGLSLQGDLNAHVDDVTALMSWATGKASKAMPVKAVNISGNITGTPVSGKLDNLKLSIDDMTFTGNANATWLGKPNISADFETGVVNLDKFIGTAPASTSETSASTSAPEKAPDLSGLKIANANITLKMAGLIAKGTQLGATTAHAKITDGTLDASISPATLFGGTIKADVKASAKSFALDAILNNVDVEPVLTQFAGFTRLSGRGDATVNVQGPMGTPTAIKRGLNGKGNFMFRDGALKGINLAALVRNAKSLLTGQKPQGIGERETTDFTELNGTYTINNGIVTNNDLKMLSPLVRVAGKGTVNLPESTVNYRVEANLVADITGQGGSLDKTGVIVPVMITGPFSKLSFTPDMKALVMGNLDAGGQLIDAAKNLKKDDLKNLGDNALKGLLGGKTQTEAAPQPGDATSAPPPPDAQQDPAKQLLDGLLGGQR